MIFSFHTKKLLFKNQFNVIRICNKNELLINLEKEKI